MPKKNASALVTTAEYRTLLSDIRREMERGVKKIEELFEERKILSYWAIGRRINTYLTTHEQPRGAIGRFYQSLSTDLDIHDRTLQQCEQFFRYFPKIKTDPQLKWSHYRFLLVEPDALKRQKWIARIKKEGMSPDDLRFNLMPAVENPEVKNLNFKTPVRGRLFTYRLLRAEDIENFDIPWFVDLGFAGRAEAPASDAILNNKYLYTSQKNKDGYRLKVVDAKVEELFTFRGKLRRVIDGDTLLVAVDLGFSYWSEQRLRLKGIDAPELNTLAGERAKNWTEKQLAQSIDIVVKTYKSDQWDRYLVDVFYLPKETNAARIAADGIWLNGQMVESGVAKIWKNNPSTTPPLK